MPVTCKNAPEVKALNQAYTPFVPYPEKFPKVFQPYEFS